MGEGAVENIVRIGIAEGDVVCFPTRIRTTGLGSCVGVVLFDSHASLAGMVHIMLPTAPKTGDFNSKKYADTGVPWLFDEIIARGATKSRLKAKIAGGAQMFSFAGKSDIMRVGPRNVEAVSLCLEELGVPVVAADTGGNVGRTIEFDGLQECLSIRTAMNGTYSI